MLELPKELKGIHSTFHVLNLKKCLVEGDVVILLDDIQLDDKLHMIEEPVEVVDREVKRFRQSQIPVVKSRFRIDFEISHKVSTLILLDLSKGIKPYTWLRCSRSTQIRNHKCQMNKSDLNDVHVNESQMIGNSLIDSPKSNGEYNQVNDRFKTSKGYHAVPPPYTGNCMTLRANLSFVKLDDYVFKFEISETVTSVNETKTSTSKTSKEGLEKPKTVRPSAPIIEE
uniref:Oxoglutarate/iron-dependent dioxygenase n=1 Tax=Tanacetum cinerariifolium TaxID=118510 RepID=A0A6L2JST0_TANCI|nr:oxoglutarate/iron-dependent dioxygenase [Tanacetum cinerariifolium]